MLGVWVSHNKIHEGPEYDGGSEAEVVSVARKLAFLRWTHLWDLHAKQQQLQLGERSRLAQFSGRGGWVPRFLSTRRR